MQVPAKKNKDKIIDATIIDVAQLANDLTPPKKDSNDTTQDIGLAVVKNIVSQIPIIGGIISELTNVIIVPIHQRRVDGWFQKIAKAISELQAKDESFDINSLKDNEEFASILFEATQIAAKTHIEEKKELLKNAVINTITTSVQYDKEKIFLEIIERLSPRHFLILNEIKTCSIANPKFDEQDLIYGLRQRNFEYDGSLLDLFYKQLEDYLLIIHSSTGYRDNFRNLISTVKLTALGEDLLKFTS